MPGSKKLRREKESLEAELLEGRARVRNPSSASAPNEEDRVRTARKQMMRGVPRRLSKYNNMKYKYIVHDERKFVYLWSHKVACSSVKAALLPLFDLDTTPYETTFKDGTRRFNVHRVFDSTDYQIGKDQLLGGLDKQYRDYFKFAFVRNPWDRLVSCYLDKIVRNELSPKMEASAVSAGVEYYANMPFAEFVEAVHQISDENANTHFRSQYLTVCGPDGEPMADVVGRFESLREDFARVAEEIGVPGLELPERHPKSLSKRGSLHYREFYDERRKSVSKRGSRHYRELYDERLQSLVHERYVKDIETFGYSF
jgi:hypothetical protein